MAEDLKLKLDHSAAEIDAAVEKIQKSGIFTEDEKQNLEALTSRLGQNMIDTKGGFSGQTGVTVNRGGISCTYNGDGSYTLNGTASAAFVMVFNAYTGAVTATNDGCDNIRHIPNGTYTATCDTANRIVVQIASQKNSGISAASVEHNSSFTVTDEMIYTWVRFLIRSGSVFDNETFYPMLRPANIKSDTYVPYAPSNHELYRMILEMQGDAAAVNYNTQEV